MPSLGKRGPRRQKPSKKMRAPVDFWLARIQPGQVARLLHCRRRYVGITHFGDMDAGPPPGHQVGFHGQCLRDFCFHWVNAVPRGEVGQRKGRPLSISGWATASNPSTPRIACPATERMSGHVGLMRTRDMGSWADIPPGHQDHLHWSRPPRFSSH